MTLYPGFQQSVGLTVNQALPGDLLSDRTAVTLAANGLFAKGDLPIGGGAFYATNGNQVANSTAGAGTSLFAGINLRNTGLSPMAWSDSQLGYGFVTPDGTQATIATRGDIAVLLTGVNGSGVADHVPVVGDVVWISTTDGTLASAPSSATTVTGYVITGGFVVTQVGLITQATVASNQSLARISK